jgi:hypothetical protein
MADFPSVISGGGIRRRQIGTVRANGDNWPSVRNRPRTGQGAVHRLGESGCDE